ncbi:hypothetical protein KIK15_02090 [Williamsia sp. CHRR-6]|nr:hypothetical protein [Williamsia sp. CHRR-6]
MKLTDEQARSRLGEHTHGVFCTIHPRRGPDPMPVVYAVTDDGFVGVPIDTVKPKSSTRLRREDNLDLDPRGSLLIEHWETEDWSRLWWVRAHLEHVADPGERVVEELSARLEHAVPQYAGRPFHHILVCQIVSITGWSAQDRSATTAPA